MTISSRRGLGRRLEVAEAGERAAVERDHDRRARSGSRRGGVSRSRPGKVAVVRRDDERGRERRDDSRPAAAQHVEEPEHRAERVAVGADVARERDDVGASSNRRATARIDARVDLGRAWAASLPLLAAWSSRMMSSTRWPCSIAGSSRNVQPGRYFSRTWRPSAARRCGAARRCSASGRRCSSLLVPGRARNSRRCLPQIGADVDARQRDKPKPRVGQPLELVGERLADDLVDPRRPRVPPRRLARARHVSRPPARGHAVETSNSSTSGAPAT